MSIIANVTAMLALAFLVFAPFGGYRTEEKTVYFSVFDETVWIVKSLWRGTGGENILVAGCVSFQLTVLTTTFFCCLNSLTETINDCRNLRELSAYVAERYDGVIYKRRRVHYAKLSWQFYLCVGGQALYVRTARFIANTLGMGKGSYFTAMNTLSFWALPVALFCICGIVLFLKADDRIGKIRESIFQDRYRRMEEKAGMSGVFGEYIRKKK